MDVVRRRRLGCFILLDYIRAALMWIAVPGFMVGAALLAVPLSAARKEHFFYGASTLSRAMQSLLAASLRHSREVWSVNLEELPADLMSRVLGWLVVVPLFVSICFLIGRALWRGRLRPLDRVETFLVLIGGTLAFTLLVLVAAHWVIDVPYPFGRTGLYLIILFVLGVAAYVRTLGQSARRPAKTASVAILAMLVVLVGRFATEFNTTYYYDWRFDSGTRQIFDIVSTWPRTSDRGPVRVAASRGFFALSLDFYRVVRVDTGIAPIAEDWEADPSTYDFFVVLPGADLELARRHANVVYVHPVSRATLLFNPKRQSAH